VKERKKLIRKRKHKRVDNIKIDPREMRKSRGSAVDIATGHGLGKRRVGVRFLVG
jgi:hypothetical protein